MSTLATCPDDQRLRQFITDPRTGPDREEVERHVRDCSRCREAVAGQVAGTDPLLVPGANTLATAVNPSRSVGDGTVPESRHANPAGASAVQPSALLRQGDRLGKYLILEVLGRGGMGVVFKAKDTILERLVAIKVLGPLLADNPSARKRFIREGQSAAAIKNDHVITVYSVEGAESVPYLVMEYVDGLSLQDLLTKAGPLSVPDVVDLGVQIAEGLGAAHRKGLVHRDVKPANILLEKETRRVKITDFGLARAADDASLTRSGEVCGTPHYMAPEQAAGEEIDHRTDLFSLGSVLYCMCTGELPFAASNPMAVLKRVCEDEPKPVEECNRSVPPWLGELIARLHAKKPSQRLQSAAEVAQALRSRTLSSDPTAVLSAVSTVAASPKGSFARGMLFPAVLGLVFLATLPAFYFFSPASEGKPADDCPEEDKAAATAPRPRPADAVPPKIPPVEKREDAVKKQPRANPGGAGGGATVKPSKPDPGTTGRDGDVKPPPTAPRPQKGFIEVKGTNEMSLVFLAAKGLRIRDQKTQEVHAVNQGWNPVPPGDYEISQSDLPPGFGLSLTRFRVSPGMTVVVYLDHKPPPGPPYPPPPGGPGGPGGRPPRP